jgi:hypothetical protein
MRSAIFLVILILSVYGTSFANVNIDFNGLVLWFSQEYLRISPQLQCIDESAGTDKNACLK